jgi:large subunit ribosomal protein L33
LLHLLTDRNCRERQLGTPCGFFIYTVYWDLKHLYTNMSQDKLIQLKNKSTGEVYWTRKNKKTVEKKIELKKYSSKLRKHVVFKEAKK